jgi:hypothetical protein
MPIQLDVDIRGGRMVRLLEFQAFNGSIDKLETKKLTISDALDLDGSLRVGGAAALESTLAVTGAVSLASTLAVAGAATLASAAVTGNATVGGSLIISGSIAAGKLRLTPDTADATITANFGNLTVVANTVVGYPALGYNIESGNAGNTWRFAGNDNALWFQYQGNTLNLYTNNGAPVVGGIDREQAPDDGLGCRARLRRERHALRHGRCGNQRRGWGGGHARQRAGGGQPDQVDPVRRQRHGPVHPGVVRCDMNRDQMLLDAVVSQRESLANELALALVRIAELEQRVKTLEADQVDL